MDWKRAITASLASVLLASVGAGISNVTVHGANLGLDQWSSPWEKRAGITHWGVYPRTVHYVHGIPKINYHAKTFRKGHHTYRVRDTFNTPGEIIGMDGNNHVSDYKVLHSLEGSHVRDYRISNGMVFTRHHAKKHYRHHSVKRHYVKKHVRKHKVTRRRARKHTVRHRDVSLSNSSLNNPSWYIRNANYVNNYLMGNPNYSGIVARDDFAKEANNIRMDVPIYHLGIVIGQLYGYDPIAGTHNSLSYRNLKSHRGDIVKAINNWKAIYQLVRKYPNADEFSATKYDGNGETGDEIATCVNNGKDIVYVNGHKMTKHDQNRITNKLESNNAYDDGELSAINPDD